MAAKILPSQQYLRECFDYDPETGVLTWKVRPLSHFPNLRTCNAVNTRFAGHRAGRIGPKGYRYVMLDQSGYRCSRLIWKLVTANDPPGEVDHENRVRDDDRWDNLRIATHMQNCWNRTVRCDNKAGFKGVFWIKKMQCFSAELATDGRKYKLGYFATAEAAAAAYNTFAATIFGEFHRS